MSMISGPPPEPKPVSPESTEAAGKAQAMAAYIAKELDGRYGMCVTGLRPLGSGGLFEIAEDNGEAYMVLVIKDSK